MLWNEAASKTCQVDLAAAYRISAELGWDEVIYNHITVRVPGDEEHFLINPFGLHFSEVTASSLVKIDLDGKQIDPGSTGLGYKLPLVPLSLSAGRPLRSILV